MTSCHGMIQGYNGQALVDEKHQIILAAEAFGCGPDNDLFQPMIKNAERNLKAIGKSEYNFKNRLIIADTGYFNEENIKYASDNNIDAYIPDQQFRKRDIRFLDRDRYKRYKPKNKFSIDDFIYDENMDAYKCPAGQ